MELDKLKELLANKLPEWGFELIEMKFSSSKERILSITVDRIEPIDMDTIVDVSNKINAFIDEIDPIENEYMLEVSSLGAEKPLKIEDLKNYMNRYIHVHLKNPVGGENIYEGDLVNVNENDITLSYRQKTRTKTVDITKDNISKIRLAIKF